MNKFLRRNELFLGDISKYQSIYNDFSKNQLHNKFWKQIKGTAFLINGYPNDAYSCVNVVLASQLGKLLKLNCEEVLFAELHSKHVTATAFTESISLFENNMFEIYPMSLKYIEQCYSKEIFYFLIQNSAAYVNVDGKQKEVFNKHFIDSSGDVFLSNHAFTSYATPNQLSANSVVKLLISNDNYITAKGIDNLIGHQDLATILFSSIPNFMIDAHDEIAEKLNKPSFEQKKISFDMNWEAFKDSIVEFENTAKI